jgi:hypothetical protein
MHLMPSREAVAQHLKAAGDLLKPDGDFKTEADAALHAGVFYSKWLPQLAVGKGRYPRSYHEFGELACYLRYVERSSRKLARSTFHGMGRWQAKLEQPARAILRDPDALLANMARVNLKFDVDPPMIGG